MGGPVIDGRLGVLAFQQGVDDAGGEAIAAANPVVNLQVFADSG